MFVEKVLAILIACLYFCIALKLQSQMCTVNVEFCLINVLFLIFELSPCIGSVSAKEIKPI